MSNNSKEMLETEKTQATQAEISHMPSMHLTDKAHISKRLYGLFAMCYIAAFNYGFSAALIGASLGQPQFLEYFPQLVTSPNATSLTGASVCQTNLGGAVGVIIVAFANDRFGRRVGFWYASIATLIGLALAAGAQNYAMFTVGRFIQCSGGWAGVLAGATYINEILPSSLRGHWGSLIGPALNLGYLAAGWTQFGFAYWTSSINWRISQVLAAIPALLVIPFLFTAPETPRYLALKGKLPEALEMLKYMHNHSSDPEFVMAREEHYQLSKQIVIDLAAPSSYWAMFTKYRNRTLAAMLICCINQLLGPQVITNYGPTIYASAGLTGTMPLLIQGVWYLWANIAALFWSRLADRWGRKPLLCYGVLLTDLAFCLVTALYAEYVDKIAGKSNPAPGQNALIFSFFLYVFFYEMGEPILFLYIAEIFPNNVRSKGIALGLFSLTITAAWLTMAFPVGLAAGGYKFLFLMIFAMAIGYVLQVLFLKETKGVPLEEMAATWNDPQDVAVYSKDINIALVEEEERRAKMQS